MPSRTFEADLRAAAALLDSTRDRLYRYVAADPGLVTRDQAADATGITRAMAAFHLDKLVDAGLLRATYRRVSGRTGRGAGRPAKLYRRSRHRFTVTVPHRDPDLLARLLVASAQSGDSLDNTRGAAGHYGRLLGSRARGRLSAPVDDARLTGCVRDVMDTAGFATTLAGSEVRARACPFDPLSREHPEIVCEAALALVQGVIEGVGAQRLEVSRREQRDWCCVVVDVDGSVASLPVR